MSRRMLYGGPAIALHLGHRDPIDFGFFGSRAFDPDRLAADVPFMADATIIQKARNTLAGIVERGGAVQGSFLGLPGLPRLREPIVAPDNGLKIASLIDLAATKVSVVQNPAEAKDYLDIDAMIDAGIDLSAALSAGRALYGRRFNPQITLKALCYFGDGNVAGLPEPVKARLVEAARTVDLARLPVLGARGETRDVR